MSNQSVFTLVNQQNGNLAFKLFLFEDNSYFDHLQRNNYYSLIWITEGSGKLKTDFSEYNFNENSLFSFTPYQPFMFSSSLVKGIAIYFHSDFFCIHKHQTEVTCNGVLFNNIYSTPFIVVDGTLQHTLSNVVEQIKSEMQNPGLAQYELLISYMKIFLIAASRAKAEQQRESVQPPKEGKEPVILQNLKEAIENDFKSKHTPKDYADLLNISPNALARITKKYFNKTLTNLIAERIIIEAKRELYLTNKSIKEVAYELGYDDEYYFNRFFKKMVNIPPQVYRETVGFGKADLPVQHEIRDSIPTSPYSISGKF